MLEKPQQKTPKTGNAPNSFDDLWVKDCDVHVEKLSDCNWWVGIYKPDGTRVSIDLTTVFQKIKVRVEEDTVQTLTPREIGWFRDPFHDDKVFHVTRVSEEHWYITPYRSHGSRKALGPSKVLTIDQWKRLEQI